MRGIDGDKGLGENWRIFGCGEALKRGQMVLTEALQGDWKKRIRSPLKPL